MLRSFLTAIAVSTATNATALSCMAPNPAQFFNTAHEAQEAYVMVHGRLVPPDVVPTIRPFDLDRQLEDRDPVSAIYRLDGYSIGMAATDTPFRRDVTVTVSCVGSWCGGFPDMITSGVYFLERKPDGTYHLAIGACARGNITTPATDALIDTLQTCLRKGACDEDDIKAHSLF